MSLIPITTRDQLPPTVELKSLKIESGDVLALTVSPADARTAARAAEELKKHLTAIGKENVLLLVLGDIASVEILDEEFMSQHGWYRRPEGETDESQ
jgi:hypothetical protein